MPTTGNRFFKAVANDGSTLDIRIEENPERAFVAMLFRPWHHCSLVFSIVEVERSEWAAWHFGDQPI